MSVVVRRGKKGIAILLFLFLLLLFESFGLIANNSSNRIKGNCIDSNITIFNNHVIGITANNPDAINATFLL